VWGSLEEEMKRGVFRTDYLVRSGLEDLCRKKEVLFVLLLTIVCTIIGCGGRKPIPQEDVHTVYLSRGQEGTLLGLYAPAFLTYESESFYNRIGRPRARLRKGTKEEIFIDTEEPAFFVMKRGFSTEKGTYLNLVYRVHFPEVPFSMVPFYLTAGDHVGLMVVVTLDERERPVLVTTVHTCGCYVATVPTTYLPPDSLPEGYSRHPLEVHGERLSWPLDYSGAGEPRLLVHLRPGVHRVMHLDVVEHDGLREAGRYAVIPASLEDIQGLESLSVDGKTTSFYYGRWPLRGHVKGSIKPWESMSLSFLSLDAFVGADKVYGDSRETGNPFYTSLKPWDRNRSDMWDFARFLKFWGWRL
jgi:hypothetical protein